MKVMINVSSTVLEQVGLSSDELVQAAKTCFENLTHPVSGHAIFFNDVQVTIVTNPSETDDFWMMSSKRLKSELALVGIGPMASYKEISEKAGDWFAANSEATRVSIITVMRNLPDE